jgi:superfamily II DNA or RNA helicase
VADTRVVGSIAENAIDRLAFRGVWRHYHELALEAFDRDIAHGRWRTHIVAPPGSGKTLLGVQIIRRLGDPALVLVPNTAVQSQWLLAVRQFTDDASIAAPEPSAPIAVLTYQSLCQLDDPAAAL